ncbi:MAG: peptidoglycan-associated lipoprotein [Legionellales bacterium RIFCSPHIGHO2_12_FULL_42_9]|nr:MAG: peptidoglycan-associated lipoprotein [Legionellales bacterium RIFCSPHIGHO2_12_FULL_42_9]
MKAKTGLKLSLIAVSIVLLASCSKHSGSASGMGDEGATAHGLGQGTHFSGQEVGESYTTQAPHNQVYLFSYDDATFNSKYMDSLNAQADYLKSHTGAHVLLAGNTDERGSREYNIALGERRADSVAELLRMAGVARNQYRVVSYGKERPVYFGHDEASHAQNRRVELTYEATQ